MTTSIGDIDAVSAVGVAVCNIDDPACQREVDPNCWCNAGVGDLVAFEYTCYWTPCSGQNVCVWGESLPSGASFPTVEQTCTATSTFLWTPTQPGGYDAVVCCAGECFYWDPLCMTVHITVVDDGCDPGEIEDCGGNCAPADWVGDASCDDGSSTWGGIPIYLNCCQRSCDEGDCCPDDCGGCWNCPGGDEGACCFWPDTCQIMTENDCTAAGGSYQGDGTDCGGGQVTVIEATGLGLSIPDDRYPSAGAAHMLSMPDSFVLQDVDIDVQISHTWTGDLIVEVSHLGTTVVIVNQPGDDTDTPGSPVGCNENNYDIMLDDEGAGGTIEDQCSPNLSSPPKYTPNNPLSAFDGMDSAGGWTIDVFDSAGLDTGTLDAWSVHMEGGAGGAGPCDVCCETTVASYPYCEGFESGFGDFWNKGELDWTWQSGSTPSSSTGPSSAHEGSYYLYTEATGHLKETAILNGPCFDLTAVSNPQLSFWYHMYGSDMGTLSVEVSDDGCITWPTVWQESRDQGNAWHQAHVDLSAYSGSTITIQFVGVTGNGYRSDMAIDQICIADCACDPCDECIGGACQSLCGPCEECIAGTCQPSCGNGTCEPRCGETCGRCPEDCPAVHLTASTPDCGTTLPWTKGNRIFLDFADDIPVAPNPGDITIKELLDGGGTGDDLGGSFAMTIEGSDPRRLRIQEPPSVDSVLTNRVYYRVTNESWCDVGPFTVDYPVQMGDVTADGRTTSADVSQINFKMCIIGCPPDSRNDINCDGRITSADVSFVNFYVPGGIFFVPEPAGHTICGP